MLRRPVEIAKSLERLGLSFGADTNASTTFTHTEYTLNLPEVDDETVDYALFLMRETADKLLLEPEAVERERGVVKAEEARGNTPSRKASRAYNDLVYPDALALIRPVIGTPETIESITAKQLREFYETHYRPERSILVLAGDFDIARMELKIRNTFEDWQNDTIAPPDPDNGSVSNRGLIAKPYNDPELTTQGVMMSASTSTHTRDSVAKRRNDFIRNFANGIVNTRVQKKLLDGNATVLSANIGYKSAKSGNQASANFSAKNDDWETGVKMITKEIQTALKYGFQQSEYDQLIASHRRALKDSVNYAAKRRSASLASGIIGAVAGGGVRTTPKSRLDAFETNVENVSIDELEKMFERMWGEFTPIIWVEGPDMESVSEADILAVYKATLSLEPEAPAVNRKIEFAHQSFGAPGKVSSRKRIEDFDIDQIVFENNVRLNLKKTDFEDNWIRLSVTVGEGWNTFPRSKPGLTNLAEAIALGGFEGHKINEVFEIFAGKKVSIGMNVASERLVFSGSTNPEDVEFQLKVWTAFLTAPGYREEWQQKFRESIEASFHTIDSTPGGVASRDLGRIWANGDKRFGMVSKEEYLELTLKDVREVLQPIFNKGAIEIGVVGDFDKELLIEAVSKTYGALPERNKNFDLMLEAFKVDFPDADRVTLTHTGAENQGALYLGWPITQPWNIDRSRRYAMVNRIMQNRMTELIREDKGLTYSPQSSLRFDANNDGYGYITAFMNSDPKFFGGFEAEAKKIASDLRVGGISQDELNRARKPVLESFERGLKENGIWLGLVTRSQTDPLNLSERRSRDAAYEAMTPETLDAAAAELFAPASLHLVMIKPKE